MAKNSPPRVSSGGSVDLDENIKKLIAKHKTLKKRSHLDNEVSRNNLLLRKYDTCRALALKARAKAEEARRIKKNTAKIAEQEDKEFMERVSSANFSVDVLASPQRGKMRPRSAPATRNSRNTSNSEKAYGLSPPPTPPSATPVVPGPSSSPMRSRSPTGSTYNPDQWWYDTHLQGSGSRSKLRPSSANGTRRPKSGKSTSRTGKYDNEMSREELKDHLRSTRGMRPKRVPPSVHLRNYRQKQQEHLDTIAAVVMEEAFVMESRAYACVEEANAYCKALGLKRRYSVYARNAQENAHNRTMAKAASAPLLGVTAAQTRAEMEKTVGSGAGARIERMMIEVMGQPGEPTQLLSLSKFYSEHDKLQMEVRRRRNLMPSNQRAQEMRNEKEEVKSKQNNLVKRRGIKQGSIQMDGDTNIAAITSKKKSKHPTDVKLSKAETEEHLNRILAETKDVTKVLEDQLRELQTRGWNENIL